MTAVEEMTAMVAMVVMGTLAVQVEEEASLPGRKRPVRAHQGYMPQTEHSLRSRSTCADHSVWHRARM